MIEFDKIYLRDCVEGMSDVDDESVDLIIADPPYNLGKDFGNDSDKWSSPEEWRDWCKGWIDESKRVLKPTGSIFVYGIHAFTCYLQVYMYEAGLKYGRMFIWHYENNWSKYKRSPAATYEPILWFTKSDKYTYHLIREPYKSTERLKHKITKGGKVWKPNPEGKHGGDVWRFPVLAGQRFSDEKVDHPTQKPLSISTHILRHFSNQGDLVLVPFAGSGSECVAAIQVGRQFIGFELNPEYVEIANSRLEKAMPNLV